MPLLSGKYRAAQSLTGVFGDGLSDREEQQFRRLRDRDIEFQHDCQRICRGLARVDALREDEELLALAGKPAPFLYRPSILRKGAWAGAAACLIIAVLLAFQGLTINTDSNSSEQLQRYITRVGEQKTVQLSEGTTITLNTGTELLVDISARARQIMLKRGEAFFDVAPDPERPFAVDVGSRVLTALGTSFNVARQPEQFTLAVVDGIVAVHRSEERATPGARRHQLSPGKIVTLKSSEQHLAGPGAIVHYDLKRNQTTIEQVDNIERYHSWRTGMLKFDGEPLVKVVQELNRYSGIKILIEDADIVDLNIVAALRIDDIRAGLQGLENGNPIEVIHHYDRFVLVGKNKSK